jgi:hypothetical protein
MTIDRRSFLYAGGLTAASAPLATGVHAAPAGGGRSVTEFGVEPNAEKDQTAALQKALDELTHSGHPVLLPAGVYMTGPLTLRKTCTIIGVPSHTILRATSPGPLLSGAGFGAFHLSGLAFEGPGTKARFLLLSVTDASVNIEYCRFIGTAAPAIKLENCSGRVTAVEITGAATGIHATGAAGLAIAGCRITSCHGMGMSVSGKDGELHGFTLTQNHLGSCVIGISAEGAGVVLGNVVAGSARYGLQLGAAKGSGHILAQSNLIRDCRIGIAVSSSGDDIMASLNMITGAKDGAIRAFDGDKLVGPDLARQSAEAYLNLMVAGNVVR